MHIMEFSVKKRDGPARIGELKINVEKIKTPNILFINTQRFKAPEFANILLTNEKKTINKPTLKFSNKLLIQRIEEKSITFTIIKRYVNKLILVKEESIKEAIKLLWEKDHQIVEGAGAVGVAALIENKEQFKNIKTVIVISGGNIDNLLFNKITKA